MSLSRILKLGMVSILAVMLIGLVTGCRDRGPRKQQIGFLITLDHPYWQNMRRGAKDEAQKLGVDVTILNAKEDPVLQIEQIRQVIA
ncbi:MAG: sugar ABC transporter substrate-binding protein, partial [Planctomycetota bacterium]